MPINTTGMQDSLIDRARAAPSFEDMIEIIEDLDSRFVYLQEEMASKDERIAELESELKDALNRPVE